MNTQKLQNDKLNLIQWITQIQDHTLIEKIKSLMSTSNDNLQLTMEQEVIRGVEHGTEISRQNSGDNLLSDTSLEHKL
jgi:hypothetical protein